MLVNPDIEAWFEKLHGHPLGRGGSAPRGVPQNYAAAAAEGIINPRLGIGDFRAPGINAERFQPRPPAPYPGERAPTGIPAPFTPMSGGGGDLGGAAKAAGLQKLGQGIMTGLEAMKARQQAQEAINKGYTPLPALDGPLSQQAARNPGATMPNIPPSSPYSPAPVGASSDIPLAAQAGAEGTQPIPPIGGGGNLPTLAQGSGGTQTAGPGPIAGNIAAARNNNPGNVSLPIAGWSGGGEIVGLRGQPGYAKFPDMQTGLDAFRQRISSRVGQGYNTIANLNTKYAINPDGSVNRSWGSGVSGASGIGLHDPIDPSNRQQMDQLQRAILSQEIGSKNAASVLSGGSAPPLTSPSASAYAAAPPNLTGASSSQLAGAVPTQNTGEPRLISPGQPQTGPAYSNDTWNNRPQYDYSGGQQAPTPLPPPRPQEQPPLLNGGQPGVYSMPDIGPQGMNDQGINPLAAALANGDQTPQLDQSAMLSMALSQPDFSPAPDFSPSFDFGGGGGFFGGLFG